MKLFKLPSSWSKYCRFIGFAKDSKREGSTLVSPFTDKLPSIRLGLSAGSPVVGVACRDDCGEEGFDDDDVVVAVCCRRSNCTGPLDDEEFDVDFGETVCFSSIV